MESDQGLVPATCLICDERQSGSRSATEGGRIGKGGGLTGMCEWIETTHSGMYTRKRSHGLWHRSGFLGSGWGAVLLQEKSSGLWPQALKHQISNHLEMEAVVKALRKFRPWIFGARLTVFSDNSSVASIANADNRSPFIRRRLQLREGWNGGFERMEPLYEFCQIAQAILARRSSARGQRNGAQRVYWKY